MKKQPKASSSNRPELQPKKRGRPKSENTDKKNPYRSILFAKKDMKMVDYFRNKPLFTKEQVMSHLVEILTHEESAQNYWRYVFSEAFYQLQQTREKATGNRFKLAHAAEEAKVEYHNMKRIFAGTGHAEIVHCFMGYFYMQGVDIQQIRYSSCIVTIAYMSHLAIIANAELAS